MKRIALHELLLSLLLIVGIVGCAGESVDTVAGGGGSSGGGIGGSGITQGTISGFGSVFVNGFEFETGRATIEVDELAATESDLRIGMIVTVSGTSDPDNLTGNADTIVFDEDLEGPAAGLNRNPGGDTREFEVLGLTVIVEKNVTVFDNDDFPGFNFNSFADTDIVEVSGFFDEAAKLRATYIHKTGSLKPGRRNHIEVKGTITSLIDSDSFMLETQGLTSLVIGVRPDTNLMNLPGDVIATGLFVQVVGDLVDASTISADRIKLMQQGFENNALLDIEGIVTDFNDVSDLRVNGQAVNAAEATFVPSALATSIADGLLVQVRGRVVNGVIEAEKVTEE